MARTLMMWLEHHVAMSVVILAILFMATLAWIAHLACLTHQSNKSVVMMPYALPSLVKHSGK